MIGRQEFDYPSPPWHYRDSKVIEILCRAEREDVLASWMPPGMSVTHPGLFALFTMYVSGIDEIPGEYTSHEAGILLPAGIGHATGSVFARQWVDNDIAQIAGREIWGLPKRLGRIKIDQSPTNKSIEVSVVESSHQGMTTGAPVWQALLRLADIPTDSEVETPALWPRIGRRAIPDPFGSMTWREDFVVIPPTDRVVHSETYVESVELIIPAESVMTELGEVRVVETAVRDVDFVLPFGVTVDEWTAR